MPPQTEACEYLLRTDIYCLYFIRAALYASGSRYCSITLLIFGGMLFVLQLFVMSANKFCFLSLWLRSDPACAAGVATRPGPYKA